MSAVYLIKSYCILSILYGCEIWSLHSSDHHELNCLLFFGTMLLIAAEDEV